MASVPAPDGTKYCKALCYYLDHIHVDLQNGRMGFLRSSADFIGALINGYIRFGKSDYSGNWERFKMSWYASNNAIAIAVKNSWPTEKLRNYGLRMEHVIPIKEIENALLKKHRVSPYTSQTILNDLRRWIIPCLITEDQDKALNAARWARKMPSSWNPDDPQTFWARYQKTIWCQAFLIDDIVAIHAPPPGIGIVKWNGTSTHPYPPEKSLQAFCDCPSCGCGQSNKTERIDLPKRGEA